MTATRVAGTRRQPPPALPVPVIDPAPARSPESGSGPLARFCFGFAAMLLIGAALVAATELADPGLKALGFLLLLSLALIALGLCGWPEGGRR